MDHYVKHVFISHSTADKKRADEICQLLEDRGVTCWIAPRDINPGRSYGEEIIHGIERTVATILVLSGNSNNSAAVRNEIERAFSYGKPIIPVRITNVKPSKGLEFFVSSAQWIDAWESPLDAKMDILARTVLVLAGKDLEPASAQIGEVHTAGSENQGLSALKGASSLPTGTIKSIGVGYIIALKILLLVFILWPLLLAAMHFFPVGGGEIVSFVGLASILLFGSALWGLFLPRRMGYLLLSFATACVIGWFTDDLVKLPTRGKSEAKASRSQ